MSFRARLLVTFLLAVLVPLVALSLFVRHEMTARLGAQYERRVDALLSVIDEDLAQEGESIAASLRVLCGTIADDNRFRRAAVDGDPDERRYLLDFAGGAMRLSGLSMLQIQDESGRILSSGHFRNEFDRLEPALPRLLASVPGGTALVRARAADAPFLALARVDSLRMGSRAFTVVAGRAVGRRFLERLARETGVEVAVVYPGGVVTSSGADSTALESAAPAIESEISVPFIDSERGEASVATVRATHGLGELRALRRSLDRWFALALVAAAVFALVLVAWLASRISRPLAELADKTARVDLDRLDIDFASARNDEIGALSRILGAMTERLRTSAAQVKDAERRATVGDLARQVNHDIKNGLTPIRNVFRHLADLARREPGQLSGVFEERRETIDSSIAYLENLASNYARLRPALGRGPVDVNDVVRRVVADVGGPVSVELCDRAVVLGDGLSLRRVVENLVDNAVESLASGPGRVTVSTAVASGGDGRLRVRITVADTGAGMDEEERARAFDDFYTTKPDGTGLGLSIVRRLVMDLDGTVALESERGRGSRFTVDLPGAGPASC